MNKKHFLILILIGTSYFIGLHLYLNSFTRFEYIKYFCPDSTEYYNAGQWLIGKMDFHTASGAIAIRPWFYPLILALCNSVTPFLIIVVQFIMWLIPALIIFYVSRSANHTVRFSFFFSLLYLSFFSLPVFTFFVVSEPTVIFLFSLTVLFLQLGFEKNRPVFACAGLLMLSMAAVTRPAYLYIYLILFVGCLIHGLKHFNFWNYKYLFLLCLTFIPIAIQYYLMHEKFGVLQFSIIAYRNLEGYVFVRSVAIDQHISIGESRALLNSGTLFCRDNLQVADLKPYLQCTSDKYFQYISGHPVSVIKSVLLNMSDNILAGMDLLQSFYQKQIMFTLTKVQNIIFSCLGIILSLITIFGALIKKNIFRFEGTNERMKLFLSIVILFNVLISGSAGLQGDRFSIINYFPVVILLSIFLSTSEFISKQNNSISK